jgi:hypothetical protein
MATTSRIGIIPDMLPASKPAICLVASLFFAAGSSLATAQDPALVPRKTVVMASHDDPYFPLAEEIARTENLEIVSSFDGAWKQHPEFLLWVVAPANLSDQVFVDLGLAIREQHASVSIGIISGSTLENARLLWQRGAQVRGQRCFAVNGEYPAARVFQGRIRTFAPDQASPLAMDALRAALQRADYLTFTGHGGGWYLSLAPGNAMTARDIPALPPVVVGTASCQTFRPWDQNSIALAFADRGAAAYAGFVYSPNEGFLIGEFEGLPFRYTWPEYPIGHVMQVQTKGTLRGFAAFPYYHLLGDPRIALQQGPPYRLVGDRETGGGRVLSYAGAPAGIVPVRIPEGAQYRFVEIPGIASAGDNDVFYESRLQAANIGDAKYLLFKHGGGGFTVRLSRHVPLHWTVLDPLRDTLDGVLIGLSQNAGDFLSVVMGALIWIAIGVRVLTKRGRRDRGDVVRVLATAFVIGLGFAAIHGAYGRARVDDVTVNEKPVAFGPLAAVGTALVVAGAAWLYLRTRTWLGQAFAILVAILPALIAAAFTAAAVGMVNVLAVRQYGTGIYNYSLTWMALLAAAIEATLFTVVFAAARRLQVRTRNPIRPVGIGV